MTIHDCCRSCGGQLPRTRIVVCRDCVRDAESPTGAFASVMGPAELIKPDGTLGPDPRYGLAVKRKGGTAGRNVGRVFGTVEARDAHPFRRTRQWSQQRACLVGAASSPPRTQAAVAELVAEVKRLASRLCSGRQLPELLEMTSGRGRPTDAVRRARVDLGWIASELLVSGASLRAVGAVFGRSPSTVKKLAEDFYVLPAEGIRFVAQPLTPDAQAYVERVRTRRKEHSMTIEQRIARLESAIAEIGQLGLKLAEMFPKDRDVLHTVDELITLVLGAGERVA